VGFTQGEAHEKPEKEEKGETKVSFLLPLSHHEISPSAAEKGKKDPPSFFSLKKKGTRK